jgi:hypothetical protein
MKPDPQFQVELRDVAPGLWIWRLERPHWKPRQGWESIVASTCVESRGETLVLDPLAPPAEVWRRLDGPSRNETPLWLPEQRTRARDRLACRAGALPRHL